MDIKKMNRRSSSFELDHVKRAELQGRTECNLLFSQRFVIIII